MKTPMAVHIGESVTGGVFPPFGTEEEKVSLELEQRLQSGSAPRPMLHDDRIDCRRFGIGALVAVLGSLPIWYGAYILLFR